MVLKIYLLIIKINNFRGDLSGISAKQSSLVGMMLRQVRLNRILTILNQHVLAVKFRWGFRMSLLEQVLLNNCLQVNFDTTTFLSERKLTQLVHYTDGFVTLRFAWPDPPVPMASKTCRCLEGLLYRGPLHWSWPVPCTEWNFDDLLLYSDLEREVLQWKNRSGYLQSSLCKFTKGYCDTFALHAVWLPVNGCYTVSPVLQPIYAFCPVSSVAVFTETSLSLPRKIFISIAKKYICW